jgi:hypothetical protein
VPLGGEDGTGREENGRENSEGPAGIHHEILRLRFEIPNGRCL